MFAFETSTPATNSQLIYDKTTLVLKRNWVIYGTITGSSSDAFVNSLDGKSTFNNCPICYIWQRLIK